MLLLFSVIIGTQSFPSYVDDFSAQLFVLSEIGLIFTTFSDTA